MTDNVVELPVVTTHDVSPTKILARASGAKLKRCVVVGVDTDGDLYFASSSGSGPEAMWLLERAKHDLLEISNP